MKGILNLLLLAFAISLTTGKTIICYYESWATYFEGDGGVNPSDIDATLCTHINYAFVGYQDDGTLEILDSYADIDLKGYTTTTGLKSKNKNLKVLLSIGGASADPYTFASIAASSAKRATMVKSARSFMEKYNFDGVDLDWEVPQGEDRDHFISLIQDFKNDFNKDGWLVTAAVSADPSEGYDAKKMSDLLDFINVMTYDMYGPWSDYTGQNSALYASSVESDWEKQNLNMEAAINNWINAGVKPSKLVAGIAFYGHTFELQDTSKTGLHAPINGAGRGGPIVQEEGSLSYLEFCEAQDSWSCKWDAEQKNPICINGNQWLGYDDEGSIRNKVAFINSKNLGGAMIWAIDMDDVKGHCGSKWPLLHAIYDNLN